MNQDKNLVIHFTQVHFCLVDFVSLPQTSKDKGKTKAKPASRPFVMLTQGAEIAEQDKTQGT